MTRTQVRFRSIDGFRLAGEVRAPAHARYGVLMVHGITANRYELGLFGLIADRLYDAGIASCLFDLRGHGDSEGTYEDVTIFGCVNDVLAACRMFRDRTNVQSVSAVSASFGAGIAAYAGGHTPELKASVHVNPRFRYRAWIEGTAYWKADRFSSLADEELRRTGCLHRNEFRFSRSMANEILFFDAVPDLCRCPYSVLILHGDRDSTVPVSESINLCAGRSRLHLEVVEGAEHSLIDAATRDPYSAASAAYRQAAAASILQWLIGNDFRMHATEAVG